MPQPFDFPGHYWDEERQKFFKIENAGTVPTGASWSREQVSHRRQRERLLDRARRRSRQGPAKRTKYYSEEEQSEPQDEYEAFPSRAVTRLAARLPFHGRETSGVGTPAAPSVSTGYCYEPFLRGSAASWYALSLQYKGGTPLLYEQYAVDLGSRSYSTGPFTAALTQPKLLSTTGIECMYVQPDPGPPGFGIVYTNYRSANGHSIKGQYIMTTEDEFVSRNWPMRPPYDKYHEWERTRPEMASNLKPSTISYHESSRNMIVTSMSARSDEPIIQVFSPHTTEPDHPANMGVTWQMGLTQQRGHGQTLIEARTVGANSVNACVPSPSGFDALCVVGTDVGISVVDLHVGQPQAAFGRCADRTTLKLRPPPYRQSDTTSGFIRQQRPSPSCAGYVASVDFVHNHPSLVVAGGRFATPWLIDLRECSLSREGTTWRAFRPFGVGDTDDKLEFDDWDYSAAAPARGGFKGTGTGTGTGKGKNKNRGKGKARRELPVWNAAHVRSVNENHVVVAGLRNTMVLYDIRYVNADPSKRATGGSWTVSGSSSNGHSVFDASIGAEPLFRFSNYFNEARMTGLGFAVDKQLGIVAAAEDHGSSKYVQGGVGLFSLATGERLPAPSLVGTLCHSAEVLVRAYPTLKTGWPTITCPTGPAPAAPDFSDRVDNDGCIHLPAVPALSFAELPGEQGPSLFAGIGSHVHKFSTRKIFEDVIDDDDDEYKGRETERPTQMSFNHLQDNT